MPSAYNSHTPTGSLQSIGGAAVPSGWLLCDGTAVSRTTYAALYLTVGNAFGSGDGSTTFNLPDLRGRFLRGADNMGTGAAGRDPGDSRTAMNPGGNSSINVGSVQSHQHLAHNHAFTVTDPLSGRQFSFTPFLVGGGSLSNANFTFTGGTNFGNGGFVCENIVSQAGSNLWNVGGTETRPLNANANYIIKY